jgi:hypothetical protein
VPRYFFHLCEPDDRIQDEEGVLLNDLQSARQFAVKQCRALIGASAQQGVVDLRSWIEIQDDQGVTLATAKFSQAVKLVTD